MWRKFFRPYAAIVTSVVFAFIGILSLISLNLHFLDPFSHGIKDYDITDIVYSRLRNGQKNVDDRIVIVNTGRPDRAVIAAMLERISAAEPKSIGVDVLFVDRKDPYTDSLLQAALEKSGKVVLSSLLENYREDLGRFEAEAGVDPFFSGAARTGYSNFPSLQTKTIRFFSPREMTQKGPVFSFAVEVARGYDPEGVSKLLKRKKELERIHYTSLEKNFIQFEAANILDTSIDLRPMMRGKIVLVGYNDAYNEDCPLLDKYYTPLNEHYTGRSEPDMYGIFIHANILQMILDRKFVHTVPLWLSLLIAVLYCYANVVLLEWVHYRYPRLYHPIIRVLQVVEFTLLFFLISLLFYLFRVKWDFTTGMLALALYFDVLLSYEAFSSSHWPWINRLPRRVRKNLEG